MSRQHPNDILFFCFQSQPATVQRSLNRKQMLRHLLDRSSLGSNKYHTEIHDDHLRGVTRAADTHDQQGQKSQKFPFLSYEAALKPSSFYSWSSPHSCALPDRLTEISFLTQKQGRKTWGSYLPGLQSRCNTSILVVLSGEKIKTTSCQ